MKKIILCAIAVIAAATMCSCGNPTTVNQAVNAAKQEKIENMTYEKAAGVYTLTDMSDIGNDKADLINEESYDVNTLTLKNNGEFVLNITIGEDEEEIKGVYTITENGVVSFDEGKTFIASKGETVTCNGSKIIIQGKLSAQVAATMVYEKAE
jgi:hypothetical protein